MDRILRVIFIALVAMASVVGCKDNGTQNIAPVNPYGPYGYPGGVVNNCVPGTVGCALTANATGYVHFTGSIGQINQSIATQMVRSLTNTWYWCPFGGCFGYSTIDIMLTPTGAGLIANVTINLGGYPIGGQANSFPINNNQGTDLQVTPFSPVASKIDIQSNNFPLDGSVTAIAAVPILYNGQQLGITSLLRSAF